LLADASPFIFQHRSLSAKRRGYTRLGFYKSRSRTLCQAIVLRAPLLKSLVRMWSEPDLDPFGFEPVFTVLT
jgi:hypothetical protein